MMSKSKTKTKTKSITHDLLVEAGGKWLEAMRCHTVITDMKHSKPETPDCIGWSGTKSTLIEVKVSRADFLRDKKKKFRINPAKGMGNHRYFLVPKGLVQVNELPTGWGLLEYRLPTGKQLKPRIVCVKKVDWRGAFKPCLEAERSLLLSAIRRIGQVCPKGISVRYYQIETKNRATVGTLNEEE